MRKFFILCLVSSFLLSATELRQLLKLPVLVVHYMEHKQLNYDLTFVNYLQMHYASTTQHDEDYEKDMRLPFKTQDSNHSSNALDLIAKTIETPTFEVKNLDFFSYAAFKPNWDLSTFLSNIWQPPRA